MTTRQLSDGRPDGTVLGQSASDKIAFFGKNARVQATTIATLALAATNATQNAVLNRVVQVLEDFGFTASS